MKHLPFVGLLCVAMASFITACNSELVYPKELCEADSAYMHGNVSRGDSLLSCYDRRHSGQRQMEMYRQLIGMERTFVRDNLTEKDFSMADSLCRYYLANGNEERYVKALLFRGSIYFANEDYPSAMKDFLQAEKKASDGSELTLKGWCCKKMGDLYFNRRMFSECVPFYRRYYELAVTNRDTLRMAYASSRMGRVHTILNNVDSTIYYYEQSIRLGQLVETESDVVSVSKSLLCDIYIQTEEYDKALSMLPRDTMNDENWAYWHLGQNHADSAKYYFSQMVGKYGPYADVQYLRLLAKLEKEQGNTKASIGYYEQMADAEDTLRLYLHEESIRNVNARFNYESIKEERDAVLRSQQSLKHYVMIASLVVLLLIAVVFNYWKAYQRRKEREVAHTKLLLKKKEEEYRQSQYQIEINKQRIGILEKQLNEALQRNDVETAKTLELETERLIAQNHNIEVECQLKEHLLQEFKISDLYLRLRLHAGEPNFRFSDDDWSMLRCYIDEIYKDFTSRLLSFANLSETEMRICYLVKVGVAPANIAMMLCKSKSAISLSRSRMYRKLTGQKGKAVQFDELILSL